MMPSRHAPVSRVVLTLVMFFTFDPGIRAADPVPPAKATDTPGKKPEPPAEKKPDWPALKTLLEGGEYAKAAAAADAIVKLVKPTTSRDPEYLPRSIDTIDALMRRGFSELQLGQLDAADATFVEADAVLADRQLKKIFSSVPRQFAAQMDDVQNHLDLRAIELANVKAAAILERLRRARLEGASGDDTATWLEALVTLEATKAKLRDQVIKRLDDDADAEAKLLGSPHKRALMSLFHQELIKGIAAFETAHVTGEEQRKQRLDKALAHFAAAATELDQVFKLTMPKGLTSGTAAARTEATVLLFELTVGRCEAMLRAGDIEGARQELERVFELHTSLAGLRRLAAPESHPDLFRPVMMSAEITLADSRKLLEQNDVDQGFVVATKAAETLARAEALPLPTDHPLRRLISPMVAAIDQHRGRLRAAIDSSDAADAAGSRLNRALEKTNPSALGL